MDESGGVLHAHIEALFPFLRSITGPGLRRTLQYVAEHIPLQIREVPSGTRVLVFPTSMGRFHEFENNGMVEVIRDRIEAGRLQLFCVDSVDAESWYNQQAHPYWRVRRHMQYEQYLLHDVLAADPGQVLGGWRGRFTF